jgi:hypothetical protein
MKKAQLRKPSNKSTQIKHGSHPLEFLITSDHLSQLGNLERLEALNVTWNELLALVLNENEWSAWGK